MKEVLRWGSQRGGTEARHPWIAGCATAIVRACLGYPECKQGEDS